MAPMAPKFQHGCCVESSSTLLLCVWSIGAGLPDKLRQQQDKPIQQVKCNVYGNMAPKSLQPEPLVSACLRGAADSRLL